MWTRIVSVTVMGLGLCACGTSTAPVRGLDEFQVIGKADLALPPDFGLVPPRAGEARPRQLSPRTQARVAIFGENSGASASEGERLFVIAADAHKVPEQIRALIHYEFGSRAYKSQALTDEILASAGMPVDATALDPVTEDERLATIHPVTGGKQVYIRRRSIREKLPGL